MAVVARFKHESMYGLSAKKVANHCREVNVRLYFEGIQVASTELTYLYRRIPGYIIFFFASLTYAYRS